MYKTCNKCRGINTSKDGSTQTTHYITIDEPDDMPITEPTNTVVINMINDIPIINNDIPVIEQTVTNPIIEQNLINDIPIITNDIPIIEQNITNPIIEQNQINPIIEQNITNDIPIIISDTPIVEEATKPVKKYIDINNTNVDYINIKKIHL